MFVYSYDFKFKFGWTEDTAFQYLKDKNINFTDYDIKMGISNIEYTHKKKINELGKNVLFMMNRDETLYYIMVY